jgi:hypothetical protein
MAVGSPCAIGSSPGISCTTTSGAVGDGAVFAFERQATGNGLVGYDISSGVLGGSMR